MSTMEAEYHAPYSGSLNALWIQRFFNQIGIPFRDPLTIHCDNQGTITTTKAEQLHQCSKHINIKIHSICKHIEWNLIELEYILSKGNLANVFTKSLPYNTHNLSAQGLGLCHIPIEEGDTSVSQYFSIILEGDVWNERECWKSTIMSDISESLIICFPIFVWCDFPTYIFHTLCTGTPQFLLSTEEWVSSPYIISSSTYTSM